MRTRAEAPKQSQVIRPLRPVLPQRKCACGGSPGLTGDCEECGQKRMTLQRHATSQSEPSTVHPIVHEVLNSSGQPLDAATRAFMEPRFGHDFSQVRIHTDARASESTRSVDAIAYTVGSDIVFGAQQYKPETSEGRRLLAHELAHVVQQRFGRSSSSDNSYEKASSPAEQEADLISDAVASGKRAGPLSSAAGGPIQLQADTTAENKGDKPAPPPGEAGTGKEPESGEKGGKKVCLTYDDGPQKGTEDVLDAHGGTIPATFFLTGNNMKSNPTLQKTLVERMLKEGHKIGNHTFTHDPMTSKEYEKAYGDLSDPAKLKKFQENYEKNEQHFHQMLGAESPVFQLARLPGNGRFVKVSGSLIFVKATEGMGMAHVTWHFEFGTNGSFGHLKALDWKGIKGVASENNTFPQPNNVILLHDRHWAGKQSLLKAIFSKLINNGCTFGQLDDSGKCA